jgi:hypothetical protein
MNHLIRRIRKVCGSVFSLGELWEFFLPVDWLQTYCNVENGKAGMRKLFFIQWRV